MKYYQGIDAPWPDVTVTLNLVRVSQIDRKIAVLPLISTNYFMFSRSIVKCLCLTVVACITLATFWTFPLAKSRILLGVTNLVILVLVILFLRSRLPMSGAKLPLVGK